MACRARCGAHSCCRRSTGCDLCRNRRRTGRVAEFGAAVHDTRLSQLRRRAAAGRLSMNTRSAPDENVIEQAIAWRVCLESGTASPHDHDACTRWRSAHADHEMAWQALAGIGDRVRTVPASLARRALHRPAVSMNRRAALRSLLLGGTTSAPSPDCPRRSRCISGPIVCCRRTYRHAPPGKRTPCSWPGR